MTTKLEKGDTFDYEPTRDDDPYSYDGTPLNKIPTETHKVIEIRDSEVLTRRVDDNSGQTHSWPPIDPENNERISLKK